MAKVLVTTWFYPGSLIPITAIAKELRGRGHEVAFYAGSRARRFVEERAFPFFALNPALEARIDRMFSAQEGVGRQWDGSDVVDMLKEFFVDTLPGQVDDIRRIHDEWGVDAILCEPAMWGPRVVLNELLKLPVALLELPAATIQGPDVGIPGLDLPRPGTWLHRWAYKAVRLGFDRRVKGLRAEVSALRHRYGLGPLPAPVTTMAADLALVLVQSCPEFDYDRSDLPANHHYVGPCLGDEVSDEPLDWFDGLPPDRPKIHVSEGTMYLGEPLIIKTALQAFADSRMSLIVATGRHREPAELGLEGAPPHVVVRRWIPYSRLLPRMDVSVNQGGGGTIIATLAMGVPSVVVPLMWDQPENARRAAYTGAALRLPAKKCTPESLRRAVDEVLREPRYRANARRMAGILAGYGGPTQSADLFEKHVLKMPIKITTAGEAV
jgi:MGT family glycosyltransferase